MYSCYIIINTHALNFYYPSEPSGFKVSSVNMTGITISWTENSFCTEFISYNVASNCSSVTCTTRRSEATCSSLPIATMCSFSIRSNVCEPMLTVNNAITVTLRRTLSYLHILFLCQVHDCTCVYYLLIGPRVGITPVYSSGSSSTLTKVINTLYPEVGVQLHFCMMLYNPLYLCTHTAAILERGK